MSEIPELITDLALILSVAGLVTLLFKKLKQPLVLGYIVAGFLVSPHMPYLMSVVDKNDIQTWADIGVMFLLFSLGLDFSIKKILKMGMAPIIATCSIIFCMMTLGNMVGRLFGWSSMNCIFLGGMLAMSSTTIIYKAFDDMGLRQQKFAGLVMSVLILEDILAIVMMVMLGALAGGSNPNGSQLLQSLLKIGFLLILWFVVGLMLIPTFLRKTRRLMNNETLLVVSLALCCLMAVVSSSAGFSSAFGAFVMGSILAETVESEKIIRLVEPVKSLFGAIFFVSVGMLVDPQILIDYAWPIICITITILLGQSIFGSTGFMLSGQPLKTAMKCGFSMAQIGEFAFIIASMGLSMGVIADFLYPVVVAVSVITTFLTPYMIRAAEPAYNMIERRLPKTWVRRLNHLSVGNIGADQQENLWGKYMKKIMITTVVYSILSTAVIVLMFRFFLPLAESLMPKNGADVLCGLLTLFLISPFLRAIIMKRNHSEEFRALWMHSHINRLPLIFTILARMVISLMFIFYVCNQLVRMRFALLLSVAIGIMITIIMSRTLKNRSIHLERIFLQNLRSREIAQQVQGQQRPQYEHSLLDRDIHIAEFSIPEDSLWAGQTLQRLQVSNRFGIHVSSILRGHKRINIPGGSTVIFPGDQLQAIGNDEQLHSFAEALTSEVFKEDAEIEKREMRLEQIRLGKKCPFVGKSLRDSGIRDEYNCMVVGVEEGQQNLTLISANRPLVEGDILWVVGENEHLRQLKAIIS